MEIYSFIDPLCPDCWGLEPVIKKLQLEYGHTFRIRHLVGGNVETFNSFKRKTEGIKTHADVAKRWERTATRSGMSCDGDLWFEDPIDTPYIASIAIKAAELQGKLQGLRFLRKMRELLFIEKQNMTKQENLVNAAKDTGLDVEEFKKDLQSQASIRAFQCDLKISAEMEVTELPTLVFFNENIEEEGLKITGLYDYEVYVSILHEMLKKEPIPEPLPSIEHFLQRYQFVATKEVAVVYDMSLEEADAEMKKLALKQKAAQVPVKHGCFWRATSHS
ncbi:ClpXP adapter SpxH family protein [Guptibacillus algicola]|uniref:ClpXP adapter SpxH family protein n=1 Tax=Guptibacillus algicola TaxID=225844 RepID=UPI001CD363F5|nr:ClpXP adapter SpxH family protein [Alkalihalobacillus algicola]MCA0987827.1 DsbA family protein [Alkalihalobacillus algicola]